MLGSIEVPELTTSYEYTGPQQCLTYEGRYTPADTPDWLMVYFKNT